MPGTNRKPCKRPCANCPWKKDSARGYLGGNSVGVYADSIRSDRRLACHSRAPGSESLPSELIAAADVCTGYVMARVNDFKSSADPVLRQLEVMHRESSHRGEIFSFPVHEGFAGHHGLEIAV